MRRLFPILLLLVFFAGCISEGSYSGKESEILLSKDVYDYNNDGVKDFYHYIYSENYYQDYKIQREVYITPNQQISSLNFKLLDESELVDALELFTSFSDTLKSDLNECAKKTGISNVKCANIEHCASKCEEASTLCKNLAQKYPIFMGYLVLSLDEAMTSRVSLTNSINADLWAYDSLSASEKQQLFENLQSFYLLSLETSKGPLFEHKKAGICTSTLTYDGFSELYSLLGTQNMVANSYTYTVILTVSHSSSATSSYKDLFVKEEIPVSFDSDSIHILQTAVVTNDGVEFSPVRSDQESGVLFYTFESSTAPSEEMFNIPQYKIREIDLFIIAPSFILFNILLPITGYYIAVSLSLALPLIILILLFNIVMFVYNYARAKMEKKTFYRAMKNFVGIPNLAWKKDLIMGAVLLAVGIGAAFFSEYVSDQSLQFSRLLSYIFEDYAALISVFCILVGSIFLYLSIQFAFKSTLLQQSYAGIKKKEQETALGEVIQLKEKLKVLKDLIDEFKGEGFDITEAYNVYVSIPSEKLERITNENIEKESKFIDSSLYTIENVITLMNERKENTEKHWAEWSQKLLELISTNKEVYLSSLTFIPVSLRPWAANRFVKEYGTRGIFFEGEVIRKKEVAPIELVNQAVKSGNILNALIIKDDKPFLSVVSSGNKTVMEGLFLKLNSYLKTFMRKSNQKEYKYLMAIGNSVVLTVVRKGPLDSLIMCPTSKFKQGFDQWKGILDSLNSQ